MSASLSDEDSKVAMAIFDSYSKTVMRHLSRKVKSAMGIRKKNEIVGTEVMKYVSDTYGQEDMIHQNMLLQASWDTAVSLQQNGCIKLCVVLKNNRRRS